MTSKKRKREAEAIILQEAQTLWNRRQEEEKERGDWMRCIAFAGIYRGRRTKSTPRKECLFEWSTPAEAEIAKEVWGFLSIKGIHCHLREGTYD